MGTTAVKMLLVNPILGLRNIVVDFDSRLVTKPYQLSVIDHKRGDRCTVGAP